MEGTVYVSFVIDLDGSLTDIQIYRSAHPFLDEEAIQVLKRSPRWEPGKHKIDGNPVRVLYVIPIVFKLR
ncbi:MAG: energy transducer TonB [Prevotellaceae bacterium]|nr:energy transducer TonB [Prevotellaceae bacterium]